MSSRIEIVEWSPSEISAGTGRDKTQTVNSSQGTSRAQNDAELQKLIIGDEDEEKWYLE